MGMHKSTNYFGRDSEWEYTAKRITEADNSRHIIYISGPGGVGKTAFLEMIAETFSHPNQPCIVLEAIDFDDLTLRLPDNFMERIARQLQIQDLEESVFQEFWELCKHDTKNLPGHQEIEKKMKRAFVTGLQKLVSQKRFVLLIDTLEKAPLWFPAFFAGVVSEISNIVVILVGRPESVEVEQEFVKAIPQNDLAVFNEKVFDWLGLPSSLCDIYFDSKEEFKQIDADLVKLLDIESSTNLKQRIWHLAQGIPFQINLFVSMLHFLDDSAYQLRQEIISLLKEVQQINLAELGHDFELRQRFQQALVAPFVSNFDRPKVDGVDVNYVRLTSRIVLLIAHVNHYMAHALGGFDASVLADLDETLTKDEIEQGLKYIEENRQAQFTFVKLFHDGIGLHDEMARMLNDFGWISLDPPGRSDSLRSEISRKLIDYYDRRCLELYTGDDERAQIAQMVDKDKAELSGRIWWQAVSVPEGQALLLARTFHSIYRDFGAGWHWIYSLSERIFRQSYFDALLYDSVEAYVRATHVIRDDDIKARMNVWNAAALIARRDRSREDLLQARELLESSISIWGEQYQDDEKKVMQLEETRGSLEDLRRSVLERQRQNPQHATHLQPAVESFNQQLDEIERSIQAKTQFSDLERAYTSLGYVCRLEGKWQEAIKHYDDALRYSRWLGNRRNIAELTNNIANVYLLWGKLTDATSYAQIGAMIREHLNAPRELGHSYRILGMINWRIGNTYGSRKYLNRARDCYEQPVDLARVDMYEGYTCYRIGDTKIGHRSLKRLPSLGRNSGQGQYILPVRSFLLLERARDIFKQHEQTNDLSWTYNVLSRAYRRDGEFEKAEAAAKKALETSQDPLRVAEANLSLCMLYYRWGVEKLDKDIPGAFREFDKVDAHYQEGFPLARDGQFVSLLSVYEGVKGNTEYARGAHQESSHYYVAFDYYLRECQIAAQNKMLRFERALNEVVADRLARMPVDLAMECTNILTDFESWEAKGLEQEYTKLKDEVDELKLFLGLPEKEQIDRMEQSFNQHMRLGDYRKALEEATNALQQFRRYNWSIGTVRILLKTAQAYRKVTNFTSARRYCKQALLVIANLSRLGQQRVQPMELAKQKAHADFTMGRILWEIGNTAEAATHFRHARETYLEHRHHKDPTIASEMREGLARSVQYEGFLRFAIGEFDQALEFLDWAESEYRDMKNIRRVSKVLNLRARIYRDRDDDGDVESARQALQEALELVLQVGDNYTIAECYLTYMNLEYQESRKAKDKAEQLEYLERAEAWYKKGASYAHDNGYALLQAVYEGIHGNVLFDRLILEGSEGEKVDLKPAFDQYLEECRWDAYFEERRFLRSLDLLMPRFSILTSDEIRYYSKYIFENWEQFAKEGKLPGKVQDGQYSETAAEYVNHMRRFCQLVEDFSEYIATEQ